MLLVFSMVSFGSLEGCIVDLSLDVLYRRDEVEWCELIDGVSERGALVAIVCHWIDVRLEFEELRLELTSKGRTDADAERRISTATATKRPYFRMNDHHVTNIDSLGRHHIKQISFPLSS